MKYYNEQVRFSVGLYTGSEATRSACAPRGLSGESPSWLSCTPKTVMYLPVEPWILAVYP